MATRLLIIGMNSFDSGKTGVAIQLVAALSKRGISVEYFKPISGHNYWYRYDHTKACIQERNLVSSDAMKVRKNFESKADVLIANPVHRLYVPAVLEQPGKSAFNSLGLAGWDAWFALQRFTKPRNGRPQTYFTLAEETVMNGTLLVTADEIRRLTMNGKIIAVSSLEDAQQYEREVFEETVQESFGFLESQSDFMIIESFNDSVWPWEGLTHVDKALVVAPGHLFAYDPDKMRRASFLGKRTDTPIREVTFSRASSLIRPTSRYALQPGAGLNKEDINSVIGQLSE